jgi:hypothetical protein
VKCPTVACAVSVVAAAASAHAAGSPSGAVQGRVLVNPLSAAVFVPSGLVKAGQDFRLRAEVTNASSSVFRNVAVTLVVPGALVLREPATQVLPRLGAVDVRGVNWEACTATAGGYVLIARATAGSFTVESKGQLVQVMAAKQPRC